MRFILFDDCGQNGGTRTIFNTYKDNDYENIYNILKVERAIYIDVGEDEEKLVNCTAYDTEDVEDMNRFVKIVGDRILSDNDGYWIKQLENKGDE